VKLALGEEIILSEPELHTLRLTDKVLFAVAVSDGITNKLSDETIVNQVGVLCGYMPVQALVQAHVHSRAACYQVHMGA